MMLMVYCKFVDDEAAEVLCEGSVGPPAEEFVSCHTPVSVENH